MFLKHPLCAKSHVHFSTGALRGPGRSVRWFSPFQKEELKRQSCRNFCYLTGVENSLGLTIPIAMGISESSISEFLCLQDTKTQVDSNKVYKALVCARHLLG